MMMEKLARVGVWVELLLLLQPQHQLQLCHRKQLALGQLLGMMRHHTKVAALVNGNSGS